MRENFIRYIKCVGTGAKHNRDLSAEEMRDAMAQMLDGTATPEQTAAFLLGWRLKPESIEEFRAALDILDKETLHSTVPDSIELGYPFDGKADNPYIFHLSAQMAAPFDIHAIVYSGAWQPSKPGMTIRDVNKAIGLPENVHCFDRGHYCPKLEKLSPIRQKLGLRTGLNTLERLPNVAGSDTALIGVFHKPYVKKYIDIFAGRYRRLVIVKGNEGTPEIFGKCRLWRCEEGSVEEIVIDPAHFGIAYEKSFTPISKETSIDMMANPSKDLLQIARLNAAVWLFSKGVVGSVDEGWERLNG